MQQYRTNGVSDVICPQEFDIFILQNASAIGKTTSPMSFPTGKSILSFCITQQYRTRGISDAIYPQEIEIFISQNATASDKRHLQCHFYIGILIFCGTCHPDCKSVALKGHNWMTPIVAGVTLPCQASGCGIVHQVKAAGINGPKKSTNQKVYYCICARAWASLHLELRGSRLKLFLKRNQYRNWHAQNGTVSDKSPIQLSFKKTNIGIWQNATVSDESHFQCHIPTVK